MGNAEVQPSRVIWHMESTNPELVEPLREKLREVVDPELGLNVIELGLIRDMRIAEGAAEMNMILTTPFCDAHVAD